MSVLVLLQRYDSVIFNLRISMFAEKYCLRYLFVIFSDISHKTFMAYSAVYKVKDSNFVEFLRRYGEEKLKNFHRILQ